MQSRQGLEASSRELREAPDRDRASCPRPRGGITFRATGQEGGALAARLSPGEVLVLGDLAGEGGLPGKLEAAWQAEPLAPEPLAPEPLPPEIPRGYPVPRRDSHAWFLVTGAQAAVLFAKLCAVDLRPAKFAHLSVAQTSVARLSAIVIRDDQGGTLAYHLLADSASAEYLWDSLIDAMAEFDGRAVGLLAAKALAGG